MRVLTTTLLNGARATGIIAMCAAIPGMVTICQKHRACITAAHMCIKANIQPKTNNQITFARSFNRSGTSSGRIDSEILESLRVTLV